MNSYINILSASDLKSFKITLKTLFNGPCELVQLNLVFMAVYSVNGLIDGYRVVQIDNRYYLQKST